MLYIIESTQAQRQSVSAEMMMMIEKYSISLHCLATPTAGSLRNVSTSLGIAHFCDVAQPGDCSIDWLTEQMVRHGCPGNGISHHA